MHYQSHLYVLNVWKLSDRCQTCLYILGIKENLDHIEADIVWTAIRFLIQPSIQDSL